LVRKNEGNALDFSFSGLKTACCITCVSIPNTRRRFALAKKRCSAAKKIRTMLPLCGPQTLALVREFQNAVCATG